MSLHQNDLAAIRVEYRMGELTEEEVDADPLVQFQRWFTEAVERQVMEPNAMVLSTVSDTGIPSSRIVLLKQLDGSGFSFFTNYESQKGRELDACPNAALLFFWPELQRQIRITGVAEKLPEEQSDSYFNSRPKGSRLGALASPQSREIASRGVLDSKLAELEVAFKGTDTVPRPTHWGGYRVQPDQIEFWQGRSNRLHDRIVYKRENDGWTISRLAP
jgi:pyridoxamine-phosphate oxidase